jgi:D-tyrosyl-tRNA(Tyr) deacylase
MKAVIQRVKKGSVSVDGKIVSEIGKGLVVLVCAEKNDNEKIIEWMANKIINLRIFSDEEGKFNLSVKDVGGEVLLISNFTVCGFLKKGTRPSFHLAEEPEKAQKSIEILAKKIENAGIPIKTGIFGAYMEVSIINDGPVTIFLEKSNN